MTPNAKPASPERIALALSGGNALGAFQAGAYTVLHDAGLHPDRIIGTSIGAVNGAIIAGSPADQRIERLRRFWTLASAPSADWPPMAWTDDAGRLTAQARTLLFGRPGIFMPDPAGIIPAWAGHDGQAGAYDLAPLGATLESLVDFDRLNSGAIRLTVVAADLETGDEVVFDTQRQRIGPDHILASTALVPEFQPVEIGGRLLGDGALRMNLPIEPLLRAPPEEPLLCFAIDLFSSAGERPGSMTAALNRRQELMFSSQSRLMLEAHRREDRLRRLMGALADLIPEDRRDSPEVREALAEAKRTGLSLIPLICPATEDSLAIRSFDYSQRAISARWRAGELAAADALRARSERGRVPPAR